LPHNYFRSGIIIRPTARREFLVIRNTARKPQICKCDDGIRIFYPILRTGELVLRKVD
jgi:hypothetical protein